MGAEQRYPSGGRGDVYILGPALHLRGLAGQGTRRSGLLQLHSTGNATQLPSVTLTVKTAQCYTRYHVFT